MQSEYKTSDKQNESFSHCQSSCLESPFEEIALAFSGGGFRAAGFSLGVLSYFDSIIIDNSSNTTLLQNVKYIASTSGGTITASLYTLFNSQGKSFNEAYYKIFDALDEQHLLEKALSILNDNPAWKDRPDKSRNLINAFAMAYDTNILFEGATMNDLVSNSSTHLEEVCFNATEFYKGRSFCQQIKLKPDPKNALDKYFYYGGHYAHLGTPPTLDAAVLHLKLADVLAASSCFPAGFEPIIYPNDFTYGTLNKQTLEKALTLEIQNDSKKEQAFREAKTFGLMDGGVDDNQALDSLMKADERRIKGETAFKRFDLVLVNDVASYFMDGYEVNPKNKKCILGKLTFKHIKATLVTLFIVSLILLSLSIFSSCCFKSKVFFVALGCLLFGLTLLPLVLYIMLRKELYAEDKNDGKSKSSKNLNLEKNFSVEVIQNITSYLDDTKLSIIYKMISARLRSVLTLNNDVFLKRIRKVINDSFYEAPLWEDRRKGNHIYDLSADNKINRNKPRKDLTAVEKLFLEPSKDIETIANVAHNMGTTLWFDKKDKNMRKELITCGQFTTCYNLLEYIYVLEKLECYRENQVVNTIKEKLESDWTKFNNTPYFLYDKTKRTSR